MNRIDSIDIDDKEDYDLANYLILEVKKKLF